MSEFLNTADDIQKKNDTSGVHFARKNEDELVEELSESIRKSDLGATKSARAVSKQMHMKYTDGGQYQ